jgi:BMFP domain-containing protein YqiC
MAKKAEKKTGGGTHVGKVGTEAPRGSQSRMEAEGERFLKALSAMVERHIPETQRKAVERLTQRARSLLSQSEKAIEENARRAVERLNIPTRKDLEAYNKKFDATTKRLRENIDEGVKKGLARFNFATNREVEEIAKAVRKLRKDVDALRKGTSTGRKAAARKTA